MTEAARIFTEDELTRLFPSRVSDDFFEALYGDAAEGAYDIELGFVGSADDRLDFEFRLKQRPGKCLACNLTHGLPQVFSRHPVINLNGVVSAIAERLGMAPDRLDPSLGRTMERDGSTHVIPLTIRLS